MPPMPGSAPPPGSDGQHFMQQQSQIFVFSTNLANKAADMVRAGHYPSIRDYHMDQPNTKAYLQVSLRRLIHHALIDRLTCWLSLLL